MPRKCRLGLQLSVADRNTIANFSSDVPVFTAMAQSASGAVEDVAHAFPDVVSYVEELRKNAELGSQFAAPASLTSEQTTVLLWHYERVYRILWVLAGYALARHDPSGTKRPLLRVSDEYIKHFDRRQMHFLVTTWQLAGMLPSHVPIPPVDGAT
ncbi:MAG: hypothetical protein HY235_25275 [Acidobacteria bacterium]|nr:hypothetical protein [Acidobacteriota bacterium]